MGITDDEEEELKRIISQKCIKGDGEISHRDIYEVSRKFFKNRKHLLLGDSSETILDAVISDVAKGIHSVNVVRLHTLIDKVEKGEFDDSTDELLPNSLMKKPHEDSWNLHLGDKVVIDLPKGRFKFLQKQTLGWTKRLGNVQGEYGYVTDVHNQYDRIIEVYFPRILTSTTVYAGVLRKTDMAFPTVASRWKVGDFVKTKKSKKLITQFQKKMGDIPKEHINKQGKVIAVTSAGIFVTFNNRSSYAVNPSALEEVSCSVSFSNENVTDHPKGFLVGMEVKIISNLKKLIENQKDSGGWNWKMSSLAGQTVRITDIGQDGSLIVGMKAGRVWRLNFQSAYSDDFDYSCHYTNDLPFLPGDVVRLKLSASIKMNLVSAKVLESCLDFLKLPGKVEGIDDEFRVVVRFYNGKKRILSPCLIQKVPKDKEKRFKMNENRRESLCAGDRVRISPGPSRYIQDILSKMRVKASTRSSIIEESELLGYADVEHAVIRYGGNRTIKINRKYIAPADQIDYDDSQKVDFEFLRLIVQNIENSIAVANLQAINPHGTNNMVDVFSVTTGSPPTVCLRINSTSTTPENVVGVLKNISDWDITSGCENECNVQTKEGAEVDIVILTHDEEKSTREIENFEELMKENTAEDSKDPLKREENATKLSGDQHIFDGPKHFEVHNAGDTTHRTPNPQSFGDFKFLSFHTTGGSLYFPYIPHNYSASTLNGSASRDAHLGSSSTHINIITQVKDSRVDINQCNN